MLSMHSEHKRFPSALNWETSSTPGRRVNLSATTLNSKDPMKSPLLKPRSSVVRKKPLSIPAQLFLGQKLLAELRILMRLSSGVGSLKNTGAQSY